MSDAHTAIERLRTAFDLFDAGVDMMRQRLRRERPEALPEEIEAAIEQWLRSRDDGDLDLGVLR
jgi:hypothetical protein